MAPAAAPGPAAAAPSSTCRGTAAVVASKLTCLRERARCQPKLDRTYARYGYRCRKPKRRGASARLTLGDPVKRRAGEPYAIRSDGTVDKQTALRLFSRAVGPLPGVEVPKGAIGKVRSASNAIRLIGRYRSSLTARQRAEVDRLLGQGTPVARTAAFDGKAARKELDDAVLALEMKYGGAGALSLPTVLLTSPVRPPDDALAGTRSDEAGNCTITLYPRGQASSRSALRSTLVHEAFHCFQIMWATADHDKVADWIYEGSATWAEAAIDVERGDTDPTVNGWWQQWLTYPHSPLFVRSYGAVGFFANLQATHPAPWDTVRRMVTVAPKNDVAYEIATEGVAGEALLGTWGPGFFRQPALGAAWDAQGPLIPAGVRPSISGGRVANGGSVLVAAWARGANQQRVSLDAEVVTTDVDAPVRGRVADTAGHDYPATEGAEYCAKPGGCTCPDGGAGPGQELTGTASVGVVGHKASGAVRFRGESLTSWCKRNSRPSNVAISGAVDGTVRHAGSCGVDSTGTFIAVFEKEGSPRQLLQLDTERWTGLGTYTANGYSAGGRVTFGNGLGRSWETDRTDAPGGSFSVTAETATQFRGSVSAGMLSGDGSSVSASGSWVCEKR